MSVPGEIVNGLNGTNGGLVLEAFVLLGVFYFFKNASDFVVTNIVKQLQIISDELQKTREALVTMQQQQIHFDGRLEKVEEVVSRINAKC